MLLPRTHGLGVAVIKTTVLEVTAMKTRFRNSGLLFASLLANEPINLIVRKESAAERKLSSTTSLAGRLQMLDARSMEWTEVLVRRDPDCVVCAVRAQDSPRPTP